MTGACFLCMSDVAYSTQFHDKTSSLPLRSGCRCTFSCRIYLVITVRYVAQYRGMQAALLLVCSPSRTWPALCRAVASLCTPQSLFTFRCDKLWPECWTSLGRACEVKSSRRRQGLLVCISGNLSATSVTFRPRTGRRRNTRTPSGDTTRFVPLRTLHTQLSSFSASSHWKLERCTSARQLLEVHQCELTCESPACAHS